MHPRKARRHQGRGAAANGAVLCSRRRTVCPLVFKQLVGRQRGLHETERSVPLPPWREACHPFTRARPAAINAIKGRLAEPLPMMMWCAAAGAQFVRSFSSSWSADKPQCRG